jgi:ribulose-5-phosphate 4-epimerase/fuculose-1-phosphate aldolase
MRGHGITTVGESVEEAGVIALALNELATMNFQAHVLGQPRPISEADKDALRPAIERLNARSKTPGEPSATIAAEWRYYSRLANEPAPPDA